MKTKYSVIPFIPAVIAAIGLKIMSMFAVDGNGLLFGMNKSGINYFIIEIILGLFAVCVLINLFDRKTAPVYPVKKNFVSGVFAVISGIAIVGSSFLALINATPGNTDNYLLSIIAALFSIPAAIAMIMIGKVHFQANQSYQMHRCFLFSLHSGDAVNSLRNFSPQQRFQSLQAI